jgi:beta-galactosidase
MVKSVVAVCVALTILVCQPVSVLTQGAGGRSVRQKILLDASWRFHPGDMPGSVVTTGPAAALPAFDDRAWRPVNLPHDYVVEGAFDPKADTSHGFLPVGVGWYRKTFTLSAQDRGRKLFLDFDGVYRDSTVWLNGHLLGKHPSGYTGFRFDIGPFAHIGGKNVLAVRADARHSEGWWYEGGGLYRHVWLVKTDPVYVPQWGTFVTSQVQDSGAEVAIKTTVANNTTAEAPCRLLSRIVDAVGKVVATADSQARVPANKSVEVAQTVRVAAPRLWSPVSPSLYRLVTTIQRDGRVVDTYETTFGIRTLRYDPERGFFLNGKPVKLQGTCNHQDFAGVGVALPDRIQVYKIEKLKEMGSNAYRCSHNPPASELLDACDRLGMLVMDESRHLGDTYQQKTPRNAPYSDLSELENMLKRDRNHPSIIMWSMCNEEPLQGSDVGAKIFSAMKEVVRRLDPTRPVTAAMNGGWGRGISLVADLQGCNYNPGGYDGYHKSHPDQPIYGSETASTVSTRGIYANDRAKGYVSAYDVNHPPWGQTAEEGWRPLAERPFMAGGFVWTGFDYRGEPTPYAWPCINSHFGIMDTCGFPKDNYYYYQSWWGDKPIVHLLPHWNWPGKEGQEIAVWCHSNCDRVELFFNGQSLGAKEMPRNGHLEWKVAYAPGILEAKGYRDGKEIARDRVETTGPAASLQLTPDRAVLQADSEDVSLITVSVRDAQGRLMPVADNEVSFQVTGDAQILGVGNGDPSSHEADRASRRHAFQGLCMAIVQAGAHAGEIHVTAESPGLKPATVILHVHAARSR